MRRTFDNLERAVLRLLARRGGGGPYDGEKGSPPGATLTGPRKRSGAEREAADLVRRAIKRLKST